MLFQLNQTCKPKLLQTDRAEDSRHWLLESLATTCLFTGPKHRYAANRSFTGRKVRADTELPRLQR